MNDTIRRILVMLTGGHADCLRSTPALRAAREAFPSAVITVVTGDGTREIFDRSPHVDEVLTIASRDGPSRGVAADALEAARIGARVFRRFDVAIGSRHGGRLSAAMALASGARMRVGFDAGIPGAWTHNLGPVPWDLSLEERNALLWAPLGVQVKSGPPELPLLPEDERAIDRLLANLDVASGPLMAVHPGSDWSCQQWSLDRWAALAETMGARFGAQVVITGSTSERALAFDIIARSHARIHSAAGETSLGQLGALVRRMDAVVTVDSVVPAVALAVGTPVILISAWDRCSWSRVRMPGLTILEPDLPGPLPNARCRASKQTKHIFGCHPADCVGTQGMAATHVDRVMAVLEQILQQERAPA